MALPLTRNTNYAPDAQVKSADLNAVQDAIASGAHGSIARNLCLGAAHAEVGAFSIQNNTSLQCTSAADFLVPIELPIGSIITSLKIYISEKEASDDVVFGISEVARGSIGQPWGAGVVDFSTVTTAGEHVHNGDDVPILEDFRYGVLIACTGATETVGVSQVEITYHKPIIAVPAP